MKIILIILLIIFLLITTLFGVVLISRNKSFPDQEAGDSETTESIKDNEAITPESRVEKIIDMQKFDINDLLGGADTTGSKGVTETGSSDTAETPDDSDSSNILTLQNEEETDGLELQDTDSDSTEEVVIDDQSEEKLENGTIEFYLDGDRENGIYLGKKVCDLESAEPSVLYGEDFN